MGAHALGFAGLIVTIALIAVFFAAWLAISMELPHPEGLPWRAFIPGADQPSRWGSR